MSRRTQQNFKQDQIITNCDDNDNNKVVASAVGRFERYRVSISIRHDPMMLPWRFLDACRDHSLVMSDFVILS